MNFPDGTNVLEVALNSAILLALVRLTWVMSGMHTLLNTVVTRLDRVDIRVDGFSMVIGDFAERVTRLETQNSEARRNRRLDDV